jgi:ParB family chromosome partitioning protein
MLKSAAAAQVMPFAREENLAPPAIVMTPIRDLYLATEAPIDLSVRDSSSGSPLTDAELKASIYANGIIQPLIFKVHEGKRYVIAGNRRLRFLREIFHDALASPVQTQDVDGFGARDWREIAMDTNLSLPPHLVERYELIVAVTKDLKLSPEDARLRWGMTPRQFSQVMALGRMSPLIREKWRTGAIDAKAAQAFTLEPDTKEQDRVYLQLAKNAHQGRVTAWDIKQKVVPPNQREAGQLVAFVGVDVCKSAKIIKQEDLFATDHIVSDVKQLKKMVADKLAAKCEELVQAGWRWALAESQLTSSSHYYGTIEPAKKIPATPEEKARLAEIRQLLESDPADGEEYDDDALIEERERLEEDTKQRGFTPEQRKKAGCILKIGRDGTLSIEYGRVKPEERKSVAITERKAKTAKKKKPGEVTLTNALAQRLSESLEKGLAFAMQATPNVAVAALIAGFASNGHVVDVTVGGSFRSQSGAKAEADFASVFAGALKSTPEARVVMLTKIVAEALNISVLGAEAKWPLEDHGVQALVAAMDPKFVRGAIGDQFDVKDYFAGVNLEACVAAVRNAIGDENASKVAKMKKADAAKFCVANIPATGWLPRELRTVHYDGPRDRVMSPKDKRGPASLKKPPAMRPAQLKKAAAKKATGKKPRSAVAKTMPGIGAGKAKPSKK